MADFPTTIYAPRTKANRSGVVYDTAKTTHIYAEDVSKLDAEVVSIETILGLSPQWASASVAERIKGIRSLSDANEGVITIKGANVGIGTTGPSSKLHVYATGYPRLKVESPSGGNPGLYLINGADSANQQRSLITHAGGNINFYMINDAEAVAYTPLQLLANGNVTMAGNVGIGTTAPSELLHVKGASNQGTRLLLQNTDTGGTTWYLNSGGSGGSLGGKFTIADATAHRLTIDTSGNVGIGTTGPTAKMDILSDILRLRTAKTPATAGAAGNVGDICWDSGYLYICVATNTWKRAGLATW